MVFLAYGRKDPKHKKVVLAHIWEVFEYDGFGRHRLPNI